MINTPKDNPIPTSRDAIDSWLDVLVSMLSLPTSNKAQVRDELEDHLRSRVDDLLIMGTPEREAIQSAINELGETAELAKLISSATRTRTPFRRFAMNAVFFVLAGSVLTASVSMMIPTNGNNTLALNTETEVVEAIELEQSDDRKRISIPEAETYELLSEVADIFGLELTMTKDSREFMLNNGVFGVNNALEGEFDIDGAIDAIHQKFMFHLMGIELDYDSKSLKLMTSEEYKRSQVVIRAYPIPSWAVTDDEQFRFATSIERLLNTKHDLGHTTIQAINSSMVVAAPPAVHHEIIDMAEQLKALGEEVVHEERKRIAREQAMLKEQLQRIQIEYEQVKDQYLKQTLEMGQIEARYQNVHDQSFDGSLSDEERAQAKADAEAMILRIKALRLELKEQERRFETRQSLLFQAERDILLSEMN